MNQSIPIGLPLLTRFAERYGERRVFERTATIVALHQTGDLVALLKVLLDLGQDPRLTWLLDIPYSSHAETRWAIESLGFPPENFARPWPMPCTGGYEITQRCRAIELFERALHGASHGAERVLVLDDGGHSALASDVFQAVALPQGQPVSIVEQTARGIRLHRHTWPENTVLLVNVAHNVAKRQIESPVIAKTIVSETQSILNDEQIPLASDDEVLVIGRGIIGHAIGENLTCSHALGTALKVVVRSGPEEHYYRLREGVLSRIEPGELRGRVRLVFGCSGSRSFRDEHRLFLRDRSLLVSASSWDIEFPKDDWNASGRLTNPGSSLHETLRYRFGRRTILLANGGFPVNFRGNVNSSPPEAMQLTVTLMLAGALQSCRCDCPGWHSLETDVEQWIVSNYQKIQQDRVPVRYAEST